MGHAVPERYYVYILSCADTSLYVGSTNDLDRRIHQHNTSKSAAHYTKIRRPVLLEYAEVLATYSQARAREAELKRLSRAAKLAILQS